MPRVLLPAEDALPVPVATTGECFDVLLGVVERDLGQPAKDGLAAVATSIVSDAVRTYTHEFGGDDVGRDGSGRVSKPHRPTGRGRAALPPTTGLLYGLVQSGKTNACISAVALGIANGFRCFVVLTSDNTLLGTQTSDRFRESLGSHGPRVYRWEDWSRDPEALGCEIRDRDYLSDTGIVLVSTKNRAHLQNLKQLLTVAGARGFPALVIDDEADHASLNTREAKRAKDPDTDPSRIFECIGRIRSAIPNHIYLQVTATPQSLLLQSIDHECKPKFCILLKAGEAYVGGDEFFQDLAAPATLCVRVDADELDAVREGSIQIGKGLEMPAGLRSAICTFAVGAAHKRRVRSREKPSERYSMLIHVSEKRGHHKAVRKLVDDFLARLDRALRGKEPPTVQKKVDGWLVEAWNELKRTCSDLTPLEEIRRDLARTMTNVRPTVIDSDSGADIKYFPGKNILIGGNRLGRGLTIDGLMVTYYGRDPKQKMTDTVHQHARMFGYRRHLLDVSRLFSPRHLLTSFADIHKSDAATRTAIGDEPGNLAYKPVILGENLKPTRAGVLNPADIGAIPPGTAIYPPDPMYLKREVEKHTKALDMLLKPFRDEESFEEVTGRFVLELLSHMPSRAYAGYTWEDGRVAQMVRAFERKEVRERVGPILLNLRRGPGGRGLGLKRQTAPFSGFASGDWLAEAKAHPKSLSLIVMMEEGTKKFGWDDCRVYLPTLILPARGFIFVFNYSE